MANPFGSSPFGGTSTFGTPQTPASGFGAPATPASGFGATPNPFGQATTPSPFGGGAFGASQPAFGASSSGSLFGSSTTPAFGANPFAQQQRPTGFTFGASTPAANPFGGTASTPFGQQSQSAFGTSTFGTPAASPFGASSTPAFGATSAFGASSTPAFGSGSSPAFGAGTSPGFGGGGLFGSTGSGFGTTSFGVPAASSFSSSGSGFGGPAASGSRVSKFSTTPDTDSGATGAVFQSISAMAPYRNKSPEELRWEDYQRGDKGGAAPAGSSLFGQPQTQGSSLFGTTPTFGSAQSSSPFGASTTTPSLFGSTPSASPFSASSTPAFGASSTPAFGASTTPSLFGGATPAFGATSASAFGASTTPAFGASAPAFGAANTNPFGGSSVFGASSSAFGGSSLFGSAPRPAGSTGFNFGAASSTPAFGAPTTGSLFGASAPATGGLFGSSQPASTGFNFGGFGSTGSAFGQTQSAPLFGSTGASTGGVFGASSTPAFGFGSLQTRPAGPTQSTPGFSFSGAFGSSTPGQSGSLFGAGLSGAAQPSTGMFGQSTPSLFNTNTGSAMGSGSMGMGMFGGFGATPFGAAGQQQQQQPQNLQQQQQQQLLQMQQMMLQQQMMMGMGGLPMQSPFGFLPPLPPLFKPGSAGTAGTSGLGAGTGAGATGISSLPRASDRRPSRTPRAAQRMLVTPSAIAQRRGASRVRNAMLTRSWLFAPPVSENKVPYFQQDAGNLSSSGAPRADAFVVPRENPRALFIREPIKEVPSPFAARSVIGGGAPEQPSAPPLPKESENGTAATASPPAGAAAVTGQAGLSSPVQISEEAKRKGKMPVGEGRSSPAPISPSVAAADKEIQAILPKLKSSDWYTEPSIAELAARERALPGFCSKVKDFVVGRKGYGSVKFLGETDVRKLDLEEIIQFEQLELVVYPDEDDKPAEGTELNKPAEVTLQGVFCRSKASGERVFAGEALDRFVQRLRKKTGEQGAEFISFDPANGEWTFKVQHFSRYGLDLDDDDDDDVNPGAADVAGDGEEAPDPDLSMGGGMAEVPAGRTVTGGTQGDAEDMAEDEEGLSEKAVAVRWAEASKNRGLDLMLSAQVGFKPTLIQQMRSALFAEDDTDEPMLGPNPRAAWGAKSLKQQGSYSTALTTWQAAAVDSRDLNRTPQKMTPRKTPSRRTSQGISVTPGGSPMLLRTTPSGKLLRRGLQQGQDSGTAVTPPPESLSPFLSKPTAHSGCTIPELVPSHIPGWSILHPERRIQPFAAKDSRLVSLEVPFDEAKQVPKETSSLVYRQHALAADIPVDAALFLGRSFRVGWGPGGVLVHPGFTGGAAGFLSGRKGGSNMLSSKITVQQVAYNRHLFNSNSALVPRSLAYRLVEPLVLHMSMSKVTEVSEGSEGSIWPGREVKCAKAGQLADVCQGYAALAREAGEMEEVGGGSSQMHVEAGGTGSGRREVMAAERAKGFAYSLASEEMAWGLVNALFGEDPVQGLGKLSSPPDAMKIEADEDEEEQEGREGDGSLTLFGTQYDVEARRMFRKVNVSDWLQENVEEMVADALSELDDTDAGQLEALFVHLTGLQVDEAVEKAVERGDVRLAILLSQAGAILPSARDDIATQLKSWGKVADAKAGSSLMIEEGRRRLLSLMCGDLSGAMGWRNELDWKRFFGLVLWFQCSPDQGVVEALEGFQKLLSSGVAPCPIPLHFEFGEEEGEGESATEDVLYGLMRVFSEVSEGSPIKMDLRSLLTCRAWSPDPLDCQLAWHLQSLLEALGVVSSHVSLPQVHLDYVALLLSAGQVHWALYVLQHLAASATGGALSVCHVAREVLTLHCPVWSASVEQRNFLERELEVPVVWLEEAKAVYSRYSKDVEGELDSLLGSEQWGEAHAFLMNKLAPKWLMAGNFLETKRVAQRLVENKRSIERWTEGGGLLLDLDFLLSALEEQEEEDRDRQLVLTPQGKGSPDDMADEEEAPLRSKAAFEEVSRRVGLCLEHFPEGADELRVVFGDMLGLLSNKLVSEMERRQLAPEVMLDSLKTVVSSEASAKVRRDFLQTSTSHFVDWISAAATC